MNQKHEDALHQQPSLPGRSPGMGTPRSDTAFPSTLLMGLCLILVIVLTGVTGTKVLHLDQEREAIQLDRAVLERDINANRQLREELPQLEEQRNRLIIAVTQLEATKTGYQQTVDKLTLQHKTLAEESARLSGDNTELTSRINAVRTELGQVQAELSNAKPLAAIAKQEIATLQSQEAAVRISITEKQQQVSTLSADVQGLERRRDHTQDLLVRMAEDQKVLEGVKKSVDFMMAQLQASLAKADAASTEYSRQTKNIQTATRNLDAEIATMQTRLQTMENTIAALERHDSSFSQFLAQGNSSTQALQEQVQALFTENKRLESTFRELDMQVQQWTQRSEVPLSKINEMEEKLLPIANSLSNSVQIVAVQASALEIQTKEAQSGVSTVQKIASALEKQLLTIATATTELQSGARLSGDNGEALSKLIGKMRQELETLATVVDSLQTQTQEPSSGNQ